MKNIILSITVLAGLMTACRSNSTTEQKIDSLAAAPDTSVSKAKTCYAYIKNKDTVSLSLNMAGNAVAGNLNYNFYEKDKNSGTISGIVKGDTIIADYTFNSEGKTSYRQVAFVKKGDQLLEGYGPTQETDGRRVFTNLAGLKFGDITLSAIACK
ncbi:hypothetical protein TH53_10390 [Pedobacter lusitanus]|uniref:Lipoprotein n=1 Tax=Pedobacter lusitanus TaxID=1503925 RepID=A0A0D0FXK6_9SPHI|nr:hypothetical protein [Pedobacter lusitanus]KIO77249.1 hypothetical protein TH53_10390 [Pedobacter lusitanus]